MIQELGLVLFASLHVRLHVSHTRAGHPATLLTKYHLAGLYRDQRKYADAETLYKEVLAIRSATLGLDHPHTLDSKTGLAAVYSAMKKFDLSISMLEEAVKLTKAKLGPDNAETLGTQADLGISYRDAGRFADAIPLLEEVYEKSRKYPGRKYPDLAWVREALLTAYVRAGQAAKATALAREQVQAARKQLAAGSPELAAALAAAGQALLEVKADADAEPLLRECLPILQKAEADAWTTFSIQSLLGAALLGQKKYVAAEPLLLQGYQGMKERAARIPKDCRVRLPEALKRLVQLYGAWGKPPRRRNGEKSWNTKKASQKSRQPSITNPGVASEREGISTRWEQAGRIFLHRLGVAFGVTTVVWILPT